MKKKIWISALGYMFFSILLAVWGQSISPESEAVFSIVGLYLAQPLAAMISAIPVGLWARGSGTLALYTSYTLLIGQAVYWTVWEHMDAEAMLITGALTIIGIGIGAYLKNKRDTSRKRKRIE